MHRHELILQVRTKGNCYQLVLCLLPTTTLFNLRKGKVKWLHALFWKCTEAWKQDKASSAFRGTPAPSGKHTGRCAVQAPTGAQQPSRCQGFMLSTQTRSEMLVGWPVWLCAIIDPPLVWKVSGVTCWLNNFTSDHAARPLHSNCCKRDRHLAVKDDELKDLHWTSTTLSVGANILFYHAPKKKCCFGILSLFFFYSRAYKITFKSLCHPLGLPKICILQDECKQYLIMQA